MTVEANDFPYGLFVFTSSYRPLIVDEGVGEVEVRVTREFGTVGEVTVSFQTIAEEDAFSTLLLAGVDVEQLSANRCVG